MSEKPRYFKVDARTILTLGRESIKDNATAVLELVKNSYDAGATHVVVEIKVSAESPGERYVRIADNGCGMTSDEVEESWLRIGFSTKRTRQKTGSRRKSGEKGIGRLSADRLGASLELRTASKKGTPVTLLVDWDKFDSPGQDLSEIPVHEVPSRQPQLPGPSRSKTTGTELLITQLRQTWTLQDLKDLHYELEILTPPNNILKDFDLRLHSDIEGAPSGRVRSSLDVVAEVEVDASVEGDSIRYKVSTKQSPTGKRRSRSDTINWNQFVHDPRRKAKPVDAQGPCFGHAQAHLLFFPRKAEVLKGTQLSLSDLRAFLDRHSGVRIYRDNIRVKPYGNAATPEGDWLGLSERKTRDPAGRGRTSFRVGANQVVGAVYIGRDDNPELVDSSSREGLVHNDAYRDLQSFVLERIS